MKKFEDMTIRELIDLRGKECWVLDTDGIRKVTIENIEWKQGSLTFDLDTPNGNLGYFYSSSSVAMEKEELRETVEKHMSHMDMYARSKYDLAIAEAEKKHQNRIDEIYLLKNWLDSDSQDAFEFMKEGDD